MGPLQGIRIIELQGIGPGPFCGMMLSDMGAEVIRIDRAVNARGGDPDTPPVDVLARGRKSIGVDLKNPDGVETVLRLIETSDGLIEGFRPGVMERLGLGPDDCLARNPKLVYGRMTGWGQEGPYAMAAGHDINYIALAGALEPIGRNGEAPVPPLNLVGDFGGGGMLLAFGMACGLLEAARSGEGQVVDAAMVDGAATLMAMFHSMRAMGVWNDERGTNLLDTGSHFYDVYECSDGRYISLGSIEPQFYAELMRLSGLEGDEEFANQMARGQWPHLKERFGLGASVALLVQHPLKTSMKERKRNFRDLGYKTIEQVEFKGETVPMNAGRVPWGLFEVPWVHMRHFERVDDKPTFHDTIRVDLSSGPQAMILYLTFPPRARGVEKALDPFITAWEPLIVEPAKN